MGDQALLEIRARDVLTAHHPLLGTASSAALNRDQVVPLNHPGPLMFDVLALPVRLFGGGPGCHRRRRCQHDGSHHRHTVRRPAVGPGRCRAGRPVVRRPRLGGGLRIALRHLQPDRRHAAVPRLSVPRLVRRRPRPHGGALADRCRHVRGPAQQQLPAVPDTARTGGLRHLRLAGLARGGRRGPRRRARCHRRARGALEPAAGRAAAARQRREHGADGQGVQRAREPPRDAVGDADRRGDPHPAALVGSQRVRRHPALLACPGRRHRRGIADPGPRRLRRRLLVGVAAPVWRHGGGVADRRHLDHDRVDRRDPLADVDVLRCQLRLRAMAVARQRVHLVRRRAGHLAVPRPAPALVRRPSGAPHRRRSSSPSSASPTCPGTSASAPRSS